MPEWLSAIAAFVGLVGMFSGAYAVSKEHGLKDTLEAFRMGNQELRDMHTYSEHARDLDREKFERELLASENKCQERAALQDQAIAHLRGQIEALQSGVVTNLVTELSNTLKAELTTAVHVAMGGPDRRK